MEHTISIGPKHDLIGAPYYTRAGQPPRRMTFEELEKEGLALWGKNWRQRFREVVHVTDRTFYRWKKANLVSNGPVVAMMVAFRTAKSHGLLQEVEWER